MPNDTATFFRQFLRHPFAIGSIVPSSQALCKMIVASAGVRQAKHIVELGSGTGVATREILRQKPKDASFFALEINPEFVARTRENCPEADVIHDSAANLEQYLHRTHGKGFDAIVSGIPWASLSDDMQDPILDAIVASMAPGGTFASFGYVSGMILPGSQKFRAKLKDRFSSVRLSPIVWNNMPPALVYIAKK